VTAVAPAAVYVLCLATSIVCAGLLLRAYLRSRARLLLWTALSFVFLAINNLLLVADMVFFTQTDLWVLRQIPTVVAIAILLYGFVWEAER
jgi:hypothetical protein